MDRKFNKRQKAFIYWRARGHNLVDSVIKSGYKGSTRQLATHYGYELEKKQHIIEAIEDEKQHIFDITTITPEFVLQGIKEIAQNGKIEANRVRSWELLGKYLTMFTDKQEISQTEKENNQFSLARLSRIKNSLENHFI